MIAFRLPSPGQSLRKLALAITVTGAMLAAGAAVGRDEAGSSTAATVSYASLPAEAKQVEQLIRNGGPFAFAKDGSVFGNRERLLPARARGYYREYTVVAPAATDRGGRRIVCGGSQPTSPEACYYTQDHYASFSRIVN